MRWFDLTISLVLLAAGLALLFFLLVLLLSPITTWFRSNKTQSRLRRAIERVKRAEKLVETANLSEALLELKRAMLLDIGQSRSVIESVKDHNQNVLSRLLIISEEMGARLEGAAEVEKLLVERGEIQLLQLKADLAFVRVKGRRESQGKDVPAWSKADFEKRIKDIKRELERNTKELDSALTKLFSSIRPATSEGITYH